jgi:hypothetical protein
LSGVQVRNLLLLGALGYLGLYLYGLLMGVFSPGELIGFTIVAAAFAAIYLFHAINVHRAIADREDPRHDELMRQSQHLREKRGF